MTCDILYCDILYCCTLPEPVGWPDLLSVGGAARSYRTGTEGDAGQGKGNIPISSSDTRLILIIIPHTITIILISHCSFLLFTPSYQSALVSHLYEIDPAVTDIGFTPYWINILK